MDWSMIGGLVARHALTGIGGALAFHGYLPGGTTTEQFVSAGMVFVGVAWSWWQKTGHAETVARLEHAASYWQSKGAGVTVNQATKP